MFKVKIKYINFLTKQNQLKKYKGENCGKENT